MDSKSKKLLSTDSAGVEDPSSETGKKPWWKGLRSALSWMITPAPQEEDSERPPIHFADSVSHRSFSSILRGAEGGMDIPDMSGDINLVRSRNEIAGLSRIRISDLLELIREEANPEKKRELLEELGGLHEMLGETAKARACFKRADALK